MKCQTKYCSNKAVRGKQCNTCASRKYRKGNPFRYCYQTLKDNAKRRGKEFSITFEDFKKFAVKNKLLMGKGRTKDSYTIDRKDNDKGYSYDNIQVLSLSMNSSKGARQLVYDYKSGWATYTKPQDGGGMGKSNETPF